MERLQSSSTVAAALVLLAGCAGGGQNLKPAESAHEVAGMTNAAQATDNHVQVIAQTTNWPSGAKVLEKVEAVRVRITNNGDQPLQIRYGNIRLVAKDGSTYAAIPPFAIHGSVPTREMAVVGDPLFMYSGYMTAPYYYGVYPNIVLYDGPFAYDAGYYDTYAPYWTSEALPTPEMIAWALPEGVLQPQGYVDGYVYFQRVPSDKKQVRLDAVLTAAKPSSKASRTQAADKRSATASQQSAKANTSKTSGGTWGQQVASVSIPFRVD